MSSTGGRARRERVAFSGAPRTGKTYLATALSVAVARQGHPVRLTTATAPATKLPDAKDSLEFAGVVSRTSRMDSREFASVVGRTSRVDLLISDERGYLPLSVSDAELLFRVLGERPERRPIVVATNLPFNEWTSMLPAPHPCRAVIDRLTHRAHIIDPGPHSVRLSKTLPRLGGSTPPLRHGPHADDRVDPRAATVPSNARSSSSLTGPGDVADEGMDCALTTHGGHVELQLQTSTEYPGG